MFHRRRAINEDYNPNCTFMNVKTQKVAKMKTINKISLFFFPIVVLASCNGFLSTPTTSPEMETAIAKLWTEYAETQTAIPTITPVFPTPSAIPGPFTLIPPNPDQQVYIDPEGWYAVNFPADLKPTDKPNSFSLNGRFFETGYLPEMGYMPRAINICMWFANIVEKPAQSSVNWMPPCSVSVSSESGFGNTDYVVYENPGADPEHRFIYVKTGWTLSTGYVGSTFSWLKPISETRPESSFPPLSTEEASFWTKAIPLPANITVTEYNLPPEAQNPIERDRLFGFIPEEAWPVITTVSLNKKPTVQEQLTPFGYELKGDITKGEGLQLFRDGRLLFDHVRKVSNVYTFSTTNGPITAFVVDTFGTADEFQHSFLIQNDAIYKWDNSAIDPELSPILYEEKLLWAKVTRDSHIEIKKSYGEIIFTFESYFAASMPQIHFKAWNGHWILEEASFVIQDGEILNKIFGFQEIFSWSLVQDKPTYFFRKGSRVGLAHDGQILPLQYQDVAHGLCCGPAQNNPYMGNDSIHFFGKRDGVWYYVVVKFN